jgi:hypothetical protein
MKPQRQMLLGLAAVFAILAAGVLWQQFSQRQAGQRLLMEGPGQPVIPGLDPSSIQAVRIEVPGTERALTIARQADGSWIIPGEDDDLDPGQAEAVLTTLALLPYYQRLPGAAEGDRREYGYNPLGSLLIQIIMRDGSQHALAVGSLSPTRDSYYIILDTTPDIYVVERRAVDFLYVIMRDATA